MWTDVRTKGICLICGTKSGVEWSWYDTLAPLAEVTLAAFRVLVFLWPGYFVCACLKSPKWSTYHNQARKRKNQLMHQGNDKLEIGSNAAFNKPSFRKKINLEGRGCPWIRQGKNKEAGLTHVTPAPWCGHHHAHEHKRITRFFILRNLYRRLETRACNADF